MAITRYYFGNLGSTEGSRTATLTTAVQSSGIWGAVNFGHYNPIDYTKPWTLKLLDAGGTQIGDTISFSVAQTADIYIQKTLTIALAAAHSARPAKALVLTAGGIEQSLTSILPEPLTLVGNVAYTFNHLRNCYYDDGKGATGYFQGVAIQGSTNYLEVEEGDPTPPAPGGSDALFIQINGELRGVTPVIRG
jgi:hypothetical protein